MLTLVEYLLWVPNSIVRPPARPVELLASDSELEITLKHWQVYSLLLGSTLVSA